MIASYFVKDKRKLLSAVVCLVLAAVFIIAASGCSSKSRYMDEAGFIAFAEDEFKTHELVKPAGEQTVSYYYGEEFSYAVRSEECPGDAVKAFIDERVAQIAEDSVNSSGSALLIDAAVRRLSLIHI